MRIPLPFIACLVFLTGIPSFADGDLTVVGAGMTRTRDNEGNRTLGFGLQLKSALIGQRGPVLYNAEGLGTVDGGTTNEEGGMTSANLNLRVVGGLTSDHLNDGLCGIYLLAGLGLGGRLELPKSGELNHAEAAAFGELGFQCGDPDFFSVLLGPVLGAELKRSPYRGDVTDTTLGLRTMLMIDDGLYVTGEARSTFAESRGASTEIWGRGAIDFRLGTSRLALGADFSLAIISNLVAKGEFAGPPLDAVTAMEGRARFSIALGGR